MRVTIETPECEFCGERSSMKLPEEGVNAFLGGTPADHAFPDLPEGERYLIATGVHPECCDGSAA